MLCATESVTNARKPQRFGRQLGFVLSFPAGCALFEASVHAFCASLLKRDFRKSSRVDVLLMFAPYQKDAGIKKPAKVLVNQ